MICLVGEVIVVKCGKRPSGAVDKKMELRSILRELRWYEYWYRSVFETSKASKAAPTAEKRTEGIEMDESVLEDRVIWALRWDRGVDKGCFADSKLFRMLEYCDTEGYWNAIVSLAVLVVVFCTREFYGFSLSYGECMFELAGARLGKIIKRRGGASADGFCFSVFLFACFVAWFGQVNAVWRFCSFVS